MYVHNTFAINQTATRTYRRYLFIWALTVHTHTHTMHGPRSTTPLPIISLFLWLMICEKRLCACPCTISFRGPFIWREQFACEIVSHCQFICSVFGRRNVHTHRKNAQKDWFARLPLCPTDFVLSNCQINIQNCTPNELNPLLALKSINNAWTEENHFRLVWNFTLTFLWCAFREVIPIC